MANLLKRIGVKMERREEERVVNRTNATAKPHFVIAVLAGQLPPSDLRGVFQGLLKLYKLQQQKHAC